ncbi:MAG: tetratricopeptide repeat protein, partial [Anaerolineaceae bacterium]|nr:tetratricopeptide repeat protein [Anaerolineaceae bacterium]
RSLLLRNFQMTISEETALDITGQTEGWITGLLLSTHLIKEEISERLRLAKNSGIGLYEYLAQQVLSQQTQEMQDFLLRSSLLEEFDALTCEKVIGNSLGVKANWWDLMQKATQYNLFVLPIGDGSDYWLRYHHLFRDFLQTQITRERPDETHKIIRSLAENLVERNDWERAYELYKQLGDAESIVTLIENGGSILVAEGKLVTLSQWLDDLPGDLLNSNPTLLSLQSVLFTMRGNFAESLRRSHQVLNLLATADDPQIKALTLVRQATAYRLQGNYSQALDECHEALQILANRPQDELIRAEALRTIGVTLYQQGNLMDALSSLNQSLVAFQSVNGKQFIPKVLFEIGTIHKALGEHSLAEQSYNQALTYWQVEGNLTWQANLLNNLGVLQHLRGDYEIAARTFEKSIICSRSGINPRLEAFGLTSLGDLYRDLEAYREAQDVYKQAIDIAKQLGDRFLIFYLDLAESALNRIQDIPARAESLLNAALAAAEAGGSPYEIHLANLEKASQLLNHHKFNDALSLIKACYGYFEAQGHNNEKNRSLLLKAIAEIRLNQKETAGDSLKQVVNIITKTDSGMPLVLISREFEEFLRSVKGSLGKLVQEILFPLDNFEAKLPVLRRNIRHQASIVPFAPPKVIIQSFGKARVRINNRYLSGKDWQTQTSKDLFFLFMAHPEGLTKEQVGLYFWPDASPEELRLRFKNSLYRLRHAVGRQSIILHDDYYQFNWSIDYEYDAESFRTEYDIAQNSKDPNEKIKHYRAAIESYRGPYLPDVDESWIVAERQNYFQMNIEALLKLTKLHMDKKNFKEALRFCHLALSEDSCLEEAHRIAMRIHAAMGNRAAIVRQFERCRLALYEEIDAPPSRQTMELYKTLVN